MDDFSTDDNQTNKNRTQYNDRKEFKKITLPTVRCPVSFPNTNITLPREQYTQTIHCPVSNTTNKQYVAR